VSDPWERARNAHRNWTDEDIAEEMKPWPEAYEAVETELKATMLSLGVEKTHITVPIFVHRVRADGKWYDLPVESIGPITAKALVDSLRELLLSIDTPESLLTIQKWLDGDGSSVGAVGATTHAVCLCGPGPCDPNCHACAAGMCPNTTCTAEQCCADTEKP
jgi:hypothetical protein